MRKIQILGPGCTRCQRLAENASAAARELGIECQIEKVTEMERVFAAGVLTTPGLAVDGVLKASGRLLTTDEIKTLLS